MQRLEVSCAVRPIQGSLGVKWLWKIMDQPDRTQMTTRGACAFLLDT